MIAAKGKGEVTTKLRALTMFCGKRSYKMSNVAVWQATAVERRSEISRRNVGSTRCF